MQIMAVVVEKTDGVVARRDITLEKVELHNFEGINRAIDDSDNHETIKPIVRMR